MCWQLRLFKQNIHNCTVLFEKFPSNDQMQKLPILTLKYWILEKSWWYFLENSMKKLHFSKSKSMQKSLVSLTFSVFLLLSKSCNKVAKQWSLDLLSVTSCVSYTNNLADTFRLKSKFWCSNFMVHVENRYDENYQFDLINV